MIAGSWINTGCLYVQTLQDSSKPLLLDPGPELSLVLYLNFNKVKTKSISTLPSFTFLNREAFVCR